MQYHQHNIKKQSLFHLVHIYFKTYNYIILYWYYGLYPWGGGGVPCPPLCVLVVPSYYLPVIFYMSVCYPVVHCRSMFLIGPSTLGCIRVRGGLRTSSGIRISRRAYLKRLRPALSSQWRRWTLILCTGTVDPRMHRCVARTKLMATLLLTYPNFLE